MFSPNAGRWAIDRAQGRDFSRAFRAGAPKVEDFFAHKDNHSDYLCALHTKKARRGLHISAIHGRYFVFITRIVCKSDTSFCSLRAGAALHSLPPRTSSVDDPRLHGHRPLFLHGEQAKPHEVCPLDGANRRTKTAKPPTDTQGVGRRFGRYWIGIGALLRCIAVGGTGIEQRRAAGLRLSGRCWQ